MAVADLTKLLWLNVLGPYRQHVQGSESLVSRLFDTSLQSACSSSSGVVSRKRNSS